MSDPDDRHEEEPRPPPPESVDPGPLLDALAARDTSSGERDRGASGPASTPGTPSTIDTVEDGSRPATPDEQSAKDDTRRSRRVQPREPQIGDLIASKYRIVDRLGRGGYGTVFKAVDERLRSHVAIKILNPSAHLDPERLLSFVDEAKKITKLDHPNIVGWKVFDRRRDGSFYFVMEYIEGLTLDAVVEQAPRGLLDPARVARLLYQILDALRAAHHLSDRECVLHLDLKPNNIFVLEPRGADEYERVKVIDFGIGQVISVDQSGETYSEDFEAIAEAGPASSRVRFKGDGFTTIHSEQVLGPARARKRDGKVERQSRACTPEYASPEQCAHVLDEPELFPLDGRSDLYSLGVMGYQLLTGKLPYETPDKRADWLDVHRTEEARPILKNGVRIPRPLAVFVDRSITKRPSERWADANDAYQYLKRYLEPPAWHLAVKVAAPIVVIAVAVAILLARGVGGAEPFFVQAMTRTAFQAEQRADLGAAVPLYLGIERQTIELFVQDPVEAGTKFEIQGGGDLASLCELEPVADGRVVLRMRGLPTGSERLREEWQLFGTEGKCRSQSFSVVWVGEWAVEEDVSLLDSPGQRSFYAPTSSLMLRLSGDLRDTEAPVLRWVPDEGDPTEMQLIEPNKSAQPGEHRFSVSRARGRGHFEYDVIDRSGRRERGFYPSPSGPGAPKTLDALNEALSVEVGFTGVGEGNPKFHFKRLEAENAPELSLRTNRAASLVRCAIVDETGVSLWELPLEEVGSPIGGERRFPLQGLVTALRNRSSESEAFLGHVEVGVSDTDRVSYGSDRSLGSVKTRLSSLTIATGEIDYVVRLEGAGSNQDKIWTPEEVLYLSSGQDRGLRFRSSSAFDLHLRLKVFDEAGEPCELRPAASRGEPWALELTSDVGWTRVGSLDISDLESGLYRLVVRASADEGEGGERVDYRFRVDREAPQVELVGLGEQYLDWTELAELDPVMRVIDSSPWTGRLEITSPISSSDPPDVELSLEDFEALTALPSLSQFLSPLPWENAASQDLDGEWALTLSVEDLAGNAASRDAGARLRWSWMVDLHPPKIQAVRPTSASGRQAGLSELALHMTATERNGLHECRCEVRSNGALVESKPLQMEAAESEGEWRASGVLRLREEWEDTILELRFVAVDHQDRESERKEIIPLGDVNRIPPALRIETVHPEGVNVTRMLVVRGNENDQYVFGGDGSESTRYRALGSRPAGRTGLDYWEILFEKDVIGDYYLDEQEVTVAQFVEFIESDSFLDPALWVGLEVGSDLRGRRDETQRRVTEWTNSWSGVISAIQRSSLPVANIDWSEAMAYARFVGKALPSLVQWEYAVRDGSEMRLWSAQAPGRSPSDSVNCADGRPWSRFDGRSPDTTAAGVFAEPGICDLCGNLSEWTATPFQGELRAIARSRPQALLDPERARGEHRRWVVAGGNYGAAVQFDWDFLYTMKKEWRDHGRFVGFRCCQTREEVEDRMGARNDRPWFKVVE